MTFDVGTSGPVRALSSQLQAAVRLVVVNDDEIREYLKNFPA